MFLDMSRPIGLKVHTDAEAAKGIASRTGLGKTRHIQVHFLWIQEKVKDGDFALLKVRGTSNPADLLTKHLPQADMHKCAHTCNMMYLTGRSSVTPSI